MGCPPTPLSLSLDSTLRPFLVSSSSPSPPLTAFSATTTTTTTLSLHKSRPSPIFKLLRGFASRSPPQPVTPATLESPPPPGTFLDTDAAGQTLGDFRVCLKLCHDGDSLEIRSMKAEELDATANLLAESFAESMFVPSSYVPLLAFLVKQYVAERMTLAPHVVVLLAFYRESGAEGAAQLAGTAEITFDDRGANAAPPTPIPPRNCPYICNMAVRKTLRRRRIGWHLLGACEELITRMKAERKVYLHCRVVDKIPFNMYKKAGYRVVATDSILIWLTLQRRKHLMSKELPPHWDDTESGTPDCDDHKT